MDQQVRVWLQRHDGGESWRNIAESEVPPMTPAVVRGRCRRALTKHTLSIGERGGTVLNALRHAERTVHVETDENNPRIASILEKAEVPEDEFYVARATVNEWGWNPHTEEPYYQAKAEVKPIPGADLLKSMRDSLIAEASRSVVVPDFQHNTSGRDFLLEISTVDLHVGKVVWPEQCVGGTYNSDIAIERAKRATTKFLSRSQDLGIGQIVLPVGHDLFHFDNIQLTTARGTQMTSDQMYEQVYRTALRYIRWQIEACASVAPTKLVIVKGNHDWQSVFHLGELLAEVYRDHPSIEIDNSVNARKYHEWGQTLLGYTHGHQMKRLEELPMTMADEQKHAWARTRFHEWRCGHKHNEFAWRFKSHDSYRTTGVHFLPSLCGTDKWHHENGYHHHPRAEAHLFHIEDGHDGQITYTAKEE